MREAVRALLDVPAAFAAKRGFEKIQRSRARELRVGFGGVLEDGRPIHGGAVKLLPLQRAFGGDETECHFLYAVSSSPPRFAEGLFAECRRKGIKIVWNQNGVGYPAWAGGESSRFNEPMRRLGAMADFVVFQSEYCRVSAERFLGRWDKPSAVLYNPVDVETFRPNVQLRSEKNTRLLAAGTHGTRDRVIPILDALSALGKGGLDATLTVAGSFRWRDGEEDFSREVERRGLGTKVRRVAAFSQADAAELYRAHDVLVHPKYMDPCPTVVLEAMACGLPIVGSRSGGMPEIVSEECGVLIDVPLDWNVRHALTGDQIADGVTNVIRFYSEMSSAARQNAERRFAVGGWLRAHGDIFRSIWSS